MGKKQKTNKVVGKQIIRKAISIHKMECFCICIGYFIQTIVVIRDADINRNTEVDYNKLG